MATFPKNTEGRLFVIATILDLPVLVLGAGASEER